MDREGQFHHRVLGQVLRLAQDDSASSRTQIDDGGWDERLAPCDLDSSRTYASKAGMTPLLPESDWRLGRRKILDQVANQLPKPFMQSVAQKWKLKADGRVRSLCFHLPRRLKLMKIIDSESQFDDGVLREGARLLKHQQASAGAQIHNLCRHGRFPGGQRHVRSARALNARVFPLLPGHLAVTRSPDSHTRFMPAFQPSERCVSMGNCSHFAKLQHYYRHLGAGRTGRAGLSIFREAGGRLFSPSKLCPVRRRHEAAMNGALVPVAYSFKKTASRTLLRGHVSSSH